MLFRLVIIFTFSIFSLSTASAADCSAIFPGPTTFAANGSVSINGSNTCDGGSCSPVNSFTTPTIPYASPSGAFTATSISDGVYQHTSWGLPKESTITFSGSGTAVIYISGSAIIPKETNVNVGGNAANVLLIVAGSLTINKESNIHAHIYVGGSISVNKEAEITGSISANGSLVVDKEGSYFYSSGDADQLDGHGFCNNSTSELILHLNFDEGSGQTVADDSGNGRTATLGNSAGVDGQDATFQCEANSGYSMAFERSANQHLTTNAFTPPQDGAVSFWLRVPASPTSRQRIFGFGDGWEARWEADGIIYWDINKTGSNNSVRTASAVTETDTWVHFVFVTSVTNGTWAVYKNGVLENSGSESFSAQSASSLTVGGSTWRLTSEHLDGELEDFRIYSGVLTQSEITALATNPPQACAEVVANYRFDECQYTGASNEVIDQLGNYPANSFNNVNTFESGKIQRAVELTHYSHHLETSIPINGDFSVSTWFKKPTITSGSRYYVLGAMQSGGDLLYLDRNNNWRWGVYNASSGSVNGTFSFSSLDNNWHHMVLVYKNNQTQLYIDDNLVDTVNKAPTGTLKYIGTSYDSVGGNNAQGFRAPLDEFILYDDVLTATQISNLYNNQNAGNNYDGSVRDAVVCPPLIDHYQIIHDGQGLTCEAETVTIKACTSDIGEVCVESSQSIDIELSASGNSHTVTNSKNFTGNGAIAFNYTEAEPVTLSITDASVSAEHGFICNNNNSGDCQMTFDDAGFIFTGINSVEVAGEDNNDVTIQAVKKGTNTQSCVPLFNEGGDKAIEFALETVYPDNFGRDYTIGSSVINLNNNGNVTNYQAVTLSFDSDAKANLPNNIYDDAGNITLHARYTVAATPDNPALTITGNESFYVRPFQFNIYPKRPMDGGENQGQPLIETTADGDVHQKAGQAFDLKIEAVNKDGDITTNYHGYIAELALQRTGPVPGTNGTLKYGGGVGQSMLSSSSADNYIWWSPELISFSNGSYQYTGMTYSEVGLLNLTMREWNFNSDKAQGSSPIGRFTPDHFEQTVTIQGGIVAKHNGLVSCTMKNWVYSGQQTDSKGTIRYGIEPKLTITAKNVADGTTENYIGDFAKLEGIKATPAVAGNEITLSTPNTLHANSLAVGGDVSVDVSLLEDFIEGAATFTLSGDNHFTYTRNSDSKVAPFFADFEIPISTIKDSDDVSAAAFVNPRFSQANSNSLTVKFGRLTIDHAYGPETSDLLVAMFTQYWDGSEFVTNTDDSCTISQLLPNVDDAKVTTGNIRTGGLTEWQYRLFDTNGIDDAIGTADTKASVSGSFSSGKLALPTGLFKFSAPNKQGTLEFEYQVPTWLQYDWTTQDGSFDENPTATLSFGLFRGNDRIIYWREVGNN